VHTQTHAHLWNKSIPSPPHYSHDTLSLWYSHVFLSLWQPNVHTHVHQKYIYTCTHTQTIDIDPDLNDHISLRTDAYVCGCRHIHTYTHTHAQAIEIYAEFLHQFSLRPDMKAHVNQVLHSVTYIHTHVRTNTLAREIQRHFTKSPLGQIQQHN